MRSQSATLPAVYATLVLDAAVRRGASRAKLVAASGLSQTQLDDPELHVPLAAVFTIWESAMRALADPGFPLGYASEFSVERVPVLGFAAMTSPNLRAAIVRMARFSSIVSPSGHWTLAEAGDTATVRWVREGERTLGHRVANEAALAETIHSARQVLGSNVQALVVSFRHARPRDVKGHVAFFGGQLRWSQPHDEVTLPRALLDSVPRLSNPALFEHFERQAATRLHQAKADESVAESVARVVAGAVADGEPSLANVAKQLGMSDRTLRRALAAESTTFSAIVDAVRIARAKELMTNGAVSLAEVALALGFSEHAAFSRAYRRWTGNSPANDRRAQPR